ncbi:hypothetical protein [Bacillus sp. B-jedd]|uniref:hypothetical protein n=1 Tax=Bacillus sp. B-jedd TaxID=1476857 RepID=UPI0005155FCD|nr:hypothetical protein [Bacillus sp. B-jedd]CEG27225.1 hypothetical protein BN1002_02081 [Bacillus sp. B-jedd]
MKKVINLVIGIIGVTIGAVLLAMGNDDEPFQTRFLFKLFGLIIFIGTIVFVRKRWN